MKLEAARKSDVSLAKVEREADRAFDRMERNVDAFLDWYYSLPAEYARIAKLLIGDLEGYLTDRLAAHLLKGDAFRGVETALNEAMTLHKSFQEEYNQAVRKIINDNRVNVEGRKFHVVQSMSLDDALNLPAYKDTLDLKKRMIGGAVAGSVTAVITGKIVSKVVGKATLKKAAQVLAKVVAGKGVSSAGLAAAGAAAGGAIGSVVPGVGTAVGALIGGMIGGIAAGITVDKLMLMLEEALNRADFKRELIEFIEGARKEFKKKLKGT